MKKKIIIKIIIILIFSSQLYSASISGIVYFKNGKPVSNLKIICVSTYDTFITYTNSRGYYKFILSNKIYTTYYIFIELPNGKREKVGHQAVRRQNYTVDIYLTINKLPRPD